MKRVISSTLSVSAVFALALVGGKALADATLTVNGTVPTVTTVEAVWINGNVGLQANALHAGGAAASIYGVLAALNVYSNDANGFAIQVASTGTTPGSLTGAVSGLTIAYQVALFADESKAIAGAPALTIGTGTASFMTPGAVATLVDSGALAAPYYSGTSTPVYLGIKVSGANTDLLADNYQDTLAVTGLSD